MKLLPIGWRATVPAYPLPSAPSLFAVGRLPVGVGAAAALAFTAALVDASGGHLTGQRISDGATPPRRVFPYET